MSAPLVFSIAFAGLLLSHATLTHAAPADVAIRLADATLQRRDGAGEAIANPVPSEPQSIGVGNCVADQSFDVSLALEGDLASLTPVLQAWAGEADCTLPANRVGAASGCWPVSPTFAAPRVAGEPFTMNVRVQDLYSQLERGTKSVVYTRADGSTCTSGNPSIGVYVLALATEGSSMVGSLTLPSFRAHGDVPGRPSLLSVRGGHGVLELNYAPPTAPRGAYPAEIASYTVYCSPRASDPTTPGVALESDPWACAPKPGVFDVLPPGVDAGVAHPTSDGAALRWTDPSWICKGHETFPATDLPFATLRGFTNNAAYQVAVAANDIYGNTGMRSDVKCGIPRDVGDNDAGIVDFYPTPKETGVLACSSSGVGSPFGVGGAAIVASAVFALVRRKRSAAP